MEIVLILIISCKKDNNSNDSTTVPVLTTISVSNITQSTASCGGNITSDGGSSITSRGVCWSTNTSPTITDNKSQDGTGIGGFISSISGLSSNTTYYIRAYATNNKGTSYGNELIVKTFTGTITDIDGNLYYTITVGSQIWMASNLKTTKYRDGTSIPNITDNASWFNLTTGAYCDYDNTISNSNIYGRLYNWYTATDSHNICPIGWHIPTDAEWTTLITYIGGTSNGGKLKETGTNHWQSPNTGATNETGFTALPGGLRNSADNGFVSIMSSGNWWSSTESDVLNALDKELYSDDNYIDGGGIEKTDGLSIRCIKD